MNARGGAFVPRGLIQRPKSIVFLWLCALATGFALWIGAGHGETVTASIPAGIRPQAMAVNPATNKIYVANNGYVAVANNGSSTVTAIDGATSTTTNVPAGLGPVALAVNPVTNKIYVANNNSHNVTMIDVATNTATTVTDPSAVRPFAVAVNPVTNKTYVANQTSNSVTVIDGTTNTTIAVAAGTNPDAVG